MPTIADDFVASIARILNSAKVPCVIWGHCLLTLHGVPTIVDLLDFVVPDHLLAAGAKALPQSSRLAKCPGRGKCSSIAEDRRTRPPAFHMHIDGKGCTVGLYPQSETLWFLPPLEESLSTPTRSNIPAPYVLASDKTALPCWRPGRGAGAFKTEEHMVLAVRAHVLLEAFLRIYERDMGTQYQSFAMVMICYMEDQLLDPLDKSFRRLKGDDVSTRQWASELRQALRGH
ncbi:hypothetical protein B0I35DRAFT_448810 [Stachybotrys elegans]|uniref:Uncharacterized protein n=1 Tax=Stachybotrys elegans TaxID=80388 RepID=A0A8K0SXP2_9HYPO|nr:hypothetical protein B0I35DRAFT_448810 [Stachybotrys elegans]